MSDLTTVRGLLTAAHRAGMVLKRQRENRSDSGYHSYKMVGPKFERVTVMRHMDPGNVWWVTFSAANADVNYIEMCAPSVAKLLLAAELAELTRYLPPTDALPDYQYEPEGA